MQIHRVKSKIHRVKCQGADLNYIGSITVDEAKVFNPLLVFSNEITNLLT